ncbi:poly(ADP-ribose) polymerase family WGR domain protein (macronuclear) [Tetrahymena thermophila SB210]|uniref:Poly [ADP-ribose] polymerase n=1 Tax=Tetrahymena thermophila (strain SB210) TaxID=312017 RepID=I7MCG2_TETTS|nr:poly(ADP-ribose) polymerase family WGR domain protein [Tetrahymena thermophila SB210]EAR83835.2 poly(ADP-ribose) polymerase family WGR domain protein [Tetrahymena thermophila SB210]|eukprot:XP_001031498.2 poly(ADP-ribose) polymerase family WGR domain protein [Tetrahymena thermophila SB210]
MPPKRATRSQSAAAATKGKQAATKTTKKDAKIEDKKVTRGRKAATKSPSPSPSPKKTQKGKPAAASKSKSKDTKVATVDKKNTKAAQKTTQKTKQAKTAPAPSPKKTNKRKAKSVSPSPDTKAQTKKSPVKKVKDVPKKDESEDEKKTVKQIVKGKCAVDQYVPNSTQYTVLQEGNQIYNLTLNQSNVDANNNKFYLGQVLVKDGTNQYSVFFRWGRVGVPGQQSIKVCSSKFEAISEFQKKKSDKIKGGYTEIFIKYGEDDEDEKPKKKQTTQPTKRKDCTLSAAVQTLINDIFDMKMIESTIKEIGYDSKKMPLGKLDDKTIKQAYTVLKDLLDAVKNNKVSDYGRYSSQFYSLIPHDFGFQKMSNFILKTEEQVRKKLSMLQDLSDLKIATQLLKESDSDDSILDQNYKKLNAEIKEVTDKKTLDIIKNYVNQGKGHYSPKILEIFSVKRKGEQERYSKNIGNDTLLWHGSRISNFVGILSQGLRIAPPEAPVTGYNYGKGIYLADQFTKSCDYCAGNSDGIHYIMLIKAALGTPNKIEKTDYNANNLPKGTHSCWGWGTHGPEEFITFNGVKVPKGQEVRTKSKHYMKYNEFIIYDIAQAQIDYLIRFKKY